MAFSTMAKKSGSVDRCFLLECGVKIGTAGERTLAHITPQVVLFRPVGGLVKCLCLGRPIKRAKGDYPSGKHSGLRPGRRRRVDRNADLAHAPILARARDVTLPE